MKLKQPKWDAFDPDFLFVNVQIFYNASRRTSYRKRSLEITSTFIDFCLKNDLTHDSPDQQQRTDAVALAVRDFNRRGYIYCWNYCDRWYRRNDDNTKPVDGSILAIWLKQLDDFLDKLPENERRDWLGPEA